MACLELVNARVSVDGPETPATSVRQGIMRDLARQVALRAQGIRTCREQPAIPLFVTATANAPREKTLLVDAIATWAGVVLIARTVLSGTTGPRTANAANVLGVRLLVALFHAMAMVLAINPQDNAHGMCTLRDILVVMVLTRQSYIM